MKQTAVRENHLYSKAYAKGAHKGGRFCVVYVLRDTHANLLKKQNPLKEKLNRVGLTVTKKAGKAFQRNRAKRIIREAYRQIECEIGIKKGYIIIIVAKSEITSEDNVKMNDVKKELTALFRKLDMLYTSQESNVK